MSEIASSSSTAGSQRWAVVGGGMLGMTLAWRLARAGRAVTLFEAAAEVGGLASAWRIGDVVWDRHYHVTLHSDLQLRGLLAELGLEREMRWLSTRTGFYHDGRLHSLSNVWEYLTFPPLGLWDKARLAATILHAARLQDGRSLEGLTAEEWLRRWSGPRTVEKLWRPLLRAKLGENAPLVAASFIWATIVRLYRARGSSRKSDLFGYVPGGYARILARFAEKLRQQGVEIRTASRVARLESLPGGGVRVDGAGGWDHFDQVVLTIPPALAAELCPQLSESERHACAGVRYQGIVCASLLLRRPLAGFYVLNLTDPTLPFTGVVEMSALVDPALLGGHHLVYLPRYLSAADPFWGHDDARIRDDFLAALGRVFPALSGDDVVAFQVSRVRNVFALPLLDHSRRLPPMQTSVPGVWLVTSAHITDGTLNVNETVGLADQSVPRLLASERPEERAPAPADNPWSRWWSAHSSVDEWDQERHAAWFVRAAEPVIGFTQSDVVLDVGCGRGFVAGALAGRVGSIDGVDVSPRELAHARLRLGGCANVRLHALDPRHYTRLDAVAGRRFSVILCQSVVQYYANASDLESLLREVRRLAEPEARMLITDLPGDGGPARDVAALLAAAARPADLLRTARTLVHHLRSGFVATRLRTPLLRLRRDEIEAMLARLGLRGERIDRALTPLRGRWHLLVRFPAAAAHAGDDSSPTAAAAEPSRQTGAG